MNSSTDRYPRPLQVSAAIALLGAEVLGALFVYLRGLSSMGIDSPMEALRQWWLVVPALLIVLPSLATIAFLMLGKGLARCAVAALFLLASYDLLPFGDAFGWAWFGVGLQALALLLLFLPPSSVWFRRHAASR